MSDYQGNIIIKNPATPTGPSAYGSAPGMWSLNEVAYWIKQGVWPNPAITPDTYFPYVSLLLSTTSLGNANNNLFVDSSGAFNPISRNGNPTQGSFSPYSTSWSNYFDGSGDYLSIPYSVTTTEWWTQNFTMEMWVFNNTNAASGTNAVALQLAHGVFDAASTYWAFGTNASGQVDFYYYNGSATRVTSSTAASRNTWNHIAMVYTHSTGNISLYLNGVSVASATKVGTPQNSNTNTVNIGVAQNTYYNGYISNLRILDGTALYTSNFTPPTSPLTAITNTALLTCQSNRFRDVSTNNFTVTPIGDTRVTDFGPFSPAYPGASYNQSDITNWSTYFNGSSTYLQAPNNSAFAFGTGDFTVEMWVYFTDTGGTNKPIFDTGVSTNTGRLLIRQGDNGSAANVVNAYLSGTTAGSPTFNFNEWTHVAVVRSSGTLKIYINGVGGTGVSATANLTETAGILGKFYDVGIYFSGSMSNVRAVKGTAVYTSNFTPPTTNLTAISGTSLLTCQNAAFTDNSPNNFIITPNGTPTVTGNSPFNTVGYWSNYFNGGTDRLQVPVTSNMYLGTTYTIEAWAYYNSSSYGARPIFSECEPFQGGFAGLTLTLNTSGQLVAEYRPATSGAVTTITGPTVVPNTWFHIALVSNSSSAKLYVNGTQVGSTTTFGDYPSAKTSFVAVGSWGHGWNDPGIPAAAWIGYISNLRVVKGVAVYTSNFTPPTAPLTAISGTVLLTCQNGRFIDNSSVNNTLTPVSTVAVQSFDPFYTGTTTSSGGSIYFDGSGDTVSAPTLPIFNIGSADASVEMWVYSFNANNVSLNGQNGGPYSTIRLLQYGGVYAFTINNDTVRSTSVSIAKNSWMHLAVTITGGVARMFVNGVLQFYGTGFGSVNTNAYPYYIGGEEGIADFLSGYVSDFRFNIGAIPTSYQTSSTSTGTTVFTPPTSPLTATRNTVLLVNGMNAGIYDATTINDMETVGNAQVRYPSPFAPADYWAGWFDGNGDYLLSPSNSAFALGTGDYTVECWIYATSTPSDAGIYEGRSTGSATDGFTLTAFSGSVIRVWSGGALISSSGTSYVGQWTHVAVTRASGTTTLWINGVSQGTSSTSYNSTNSDAVVGGGRYSAGSSVNSFFPGYISNFRIVKGTAVYTSTFTPSTTPLTAIANTSLLTCQNKTFIDNSTNAFTLTAFGNAAAGAIGPFINTGGTSTYFDGSGDNLFMPSSPSMNCGSGNWTVEGWVSTLTRTTNYPLIFGNNRGSFTTDALAITASNADSSPSYLDKFVFAWGSAGFSSPSAGTSALLVSNVTNSNGVWYHLAIVRNGTSIKMYRNGTEVASATVSSGATFNWGFNGSLAGGGNWDGAQGNWNGYLDDFRVTNGVARYTANFTPPTQPFVTY